MRSFWSDPYLWIHLAGAAALPILFMVCLLGLAVGSPFLPVWLEFSLIAIAGVLPVLWMQWLKPFYIFSLLVVAMVPEKLTPVQLRLLSRFKTKLNQGLALLAPILLVIVLWQLYRIAPLAADIAPFPPGWRLAGMLLAAVAFFLCNVFLQVPLSVIGVMLTSEANFAATEALPVEQVRQNFTIVGIRVRRIVPPLEDNAQVV